MINVQAVKPHFAPCLLTTAHCPMPGHWVEGRREVRGSPLPSPWPCLPALYAYRQNRYATFQLLFFSILTEEIKFVLSLCLYLFLPFIEVPSLLSFYLPLFSS